MTSIPGSAMGNELIHLYGPFAIRSYGLMISIGLLLFILLLKRHPKYKAMHLGDQIIDITIIGIVAGLLGGRLLYTMSEPEALHSIPDFFAFWQGGFSILGCILGVLFTVPWYLRYLKAPIVPLLDLIALHAPLLQSVSRLGCFFAGCCYGEPTTNWWGVIYHDPQSTAPLGICIHPTQLYSAFLLLAIFALLYFVLQYHCTKPGQLTALYLMLVSGERFVVDFWRADRIFYAPLLNTGLSINQLISLGIASGAFILFLWVTYNKRIAKQA